MKVKFKEYIEKLLLVNAYRFGLMMTGGTYKFHLTILDSLLLPEATNQFIQPLLICLNV